MWLFSDPAPPTIPPVPCDHTKGKPCEHATALYGAVSQIRAQINRAVFLGAMIGAGVGSAFKDVIAGIF